MADQAPNSQPSAPASPAADASATIAKPTPPAIDSSVSVPATAKQLSKEEQMAAFEEDLKYNDWGHQPC
ncbi:MAG: hypothetical protein ACO1QS_03715 [Verrucomicrobiota bacterium]